MPVFDFSVHVSVEQISQLLEWNLACSVWQYHKGVDSRKGLRLFLVSVLIYCPEAGSRYHAQRTQQLWDCLFTGKLSMSELISTIYK